MLDIILKQLLGLDYEILTDRVAFIQSKLPKISYASERLCQEEFHIPLHSLLFEKGIQPQTIEVFHHFNLPAFFKKPSMKEDLPFDLFAMAFYLVSRYEEYLPYKADKYGRFPAEESLAFQSGFLERPLVNLWVKKLGELLNQKFPEVRLRPPIYSFQPTYDIDFAWAFLNKGFVRTIGGLLRNLLRFEIEEMIQKGKVFLGLKEDPFFTFKYLDSLHEKYKLNPIYFFLLADWGEFDKNISPKNPAFQKLVLDLTRKYNFGIHPSFRSNAENQFVKIEKTRLEKIAGKPVFKSRQHFLKLAFPKTYRNLLEVGIKADYTMGYASQIGFRASIAHPYKWYDLQNEQITDLTIHPFAVMDVTLKQYLKIPPEKGLKKVQALIQNCKDVEGTFTTLWHNSSLSNEKDWHGWRKVYEDILNFALQTEK